MSAEALRRSASLAGSLAIHLIVFVLVTARGPVQLTMAPAPILLTLVDAGRVTEGPGELAPELRSALGEAAPAATLPPSEPAPAREEAAPPPPEPAPPEPEKPAPVEPRPKPPVKKPLPPTPPAPKARPTPPAAVVPGPEAKSPEGSSVASVPSASTGPAGSGSDTRSTAPSWAPAARVRYEELLFAWIDRHKQYPMLAQRRGIQGSGSVRVRIDRNGRVLDRVLVRSTGQAILDEAALDMVRRASPFPAVPEEYSGSSFEFVAPVEYRLR